MPPTPIPAARLLFSVDPGVAHLNHGSFGAVPIPVQRAQQRLRDEVEVDPMRFFTQGLLQRLAHTRRHLATFLGADPDGTALVANATSGTATVLGSLRLTAGDEIVLTGHGYSAVALMADRECRRHGAKAQTVRLPLVATDSEVVEVISGAVTPDRTRLVIVDQITSPTARLFPVARLAATLQATGVPLLVDGAHVPGMLPADVATIGADFWVGNMHKWAYAPRGTAVLSVRPQWWDRIEPLIVSDGYRAGFPGALDWQGTLDYTGWLAAPVGIYTMRQLGIDAVREHNTALARYGQQVVGAALGLAPADLPPVDDGLSMAIVPLPEGVGTTPARAEALRLRIATELHTQVAVNAWQGMGLLRLSAQVYNRAVEYDRLAERLPSLLRPARP